MKQGANLGICLGLGLPTCANKRQLWGYTFSYIGICQRTQSTGIGVGALSYCATNLCVLQWQLHRWGSVTNQTKDTKSILIKPGMSLNCFPHLCRTLKLSLTLFSSCSGSIDVRGSFIHDSCHLSQSEVVVHKSRNGWKSFISLASLSYCVRWQS